MEGMFEELGDLFEELGERFEIILREKLELTPLYLKRLELEKTIKDIFQRNQKYYLPIDVLFNQIKSKELKYGFENNLNLLIRKKIFRRSKNLLYDDDLKNKLNILKALKSMEVKKLHELCKKYRIKGFTKLKKNDLIELLLNHVKS